MRFGPKTRTRTPVVTDADPQPSPRARWRKALLSCLAIFALARPAPLTMTAPPLLPPSTPPPPPELVLPERFSSRISSTTCTSLAQASATSGFSAVGDVFTRVSHQKLSGAPVITRVITQGKNVTICISRDLPDGNMIATYEATTRRLIFAPSRIVPITVVHELFHGHQHANGGFVSIGSNSQLSAGDRATAMLLVEATAAAYAMAALKEISFSDPAYARQHLGTHDYGMRETFEDTFARTYAATRGQHEDDRRRQSLAAAGQAVVRALVRGQSLEWRGAYRDQAADYLDVPSYAGVRDAAYARKRDGLYAQIGLVTPGLQLVPPEFFGDSAEKAIATTQRAFKLHAPKPKAPRPT